MKQSVGRRETLSFAGWKMDDDSTARLVRYAYSLKELDMYSLALSLSLSQIVPSCIIFQIQTMPAAESFGKNIAFGVNFLFGISSVLKLNKLL